MKKVFYAASATAHWSAQCHKLSTTKKRTGREAVSIPLWALRQFNKCDNCWPPEE